MKCHKRLQAGTVPTWWLPHFVPVSTKAGSSISFSSFSDLYTWVPRHLTFVLCREIVVSMGTALGSTGLEAELWHWIFPHLASLISKERLSDYFWLDECFAGFSFACEFKCEALKMAKEQAPSKGQLKHYCLMGADGIYPLSLEVGQLQQNHRAC